MIAIDTLAFVELLGGDERGPAAESCLREALGAGPVVVCEGVVSEIAAGLGHDAEIMDAVEGIDLRFPPFERHAAIRAGEMQRRYLQRLCSQPGGEARTIPDFLVGAHALLQCKSLITRDAGFHRDYFKGLKVIVPTAA